MKKILFLLLLIHSNSFSQVMGGSESTINSQFAINVASGAHQFVKNMNFDGNKYFYDDFEFGDIYLSDGEKPISVKTNYNILTETFDIENKKGEIGLQANSK